MSYHIDTGLIYEKMKTDCNCPLCEIQKIVEENYLHEFLNDAVMEDDARIKVGKLGFCAKHFDMMINRQNKLSVALQIKTRTDILFKYFDKISSISQTKKIIKTIEEEQSSCVICTYVNESMIKYYKTIAQMFEKEKNFDQIIYNTKGFCLNHYKELLKYSSSAGISTKNYLKTLSTVQKESIEKLYANLNKFCNKHDYRNAMMPLGEAEYALSNCREKFYGKKEK